ncbi:uncharacterized protein Dsimw501_GD27162 [Drosophila simulans]|uniref:Uncharacterized protein n=1 Tax=Drosophila simulans TaxID=7240 RepID=A0A0J9R477_DROSI|nr:uncharacterized protein Dsimw501_GD27162 [Drosophila simulans]
MVRLNVAEQHSSSNNNGNISNSSISNTNGTIITSNNNAGGSCSSTTSSTTSLNSNPASPACTMVMLPAPQQHLLVQPCAISFRGGALYIGITIAPVSSVNQYSMIVYCDYTMRLPEDRPNTSDGGSSNCSLPASPPLLQQTATPPQGAQIVPPVVSSLSSGSGGSGGQVNGLSNGTNGIAPLPPGQLYIQYPGEFYPPEYYIAPHPHEGICPQHPHHPHPHHHQPMCAMSTEYGESTLVLQL